MKNHLRCLPLDLRWYLCLSWYVLCHEHKGLGHFQNDQTPPQVHCELLSARAWHNGSHNGLVALTVRPLHLLPHPMLPTWQHFLRHYTPCVNARHLFSTQLNPLAATHGATTPHTRSIRNQLWPFRCYQGSHHGYAIPSPSLTQQSICFIRHRHVEVEQPMPYQVSIPYGHGSSAL